MRGPRGGGGRARKAQRSRNAPAAKIAAQHNVANALIVKPGAAAQTAPPMAATAAIVIQPELAARGALERCGCKRRSSPAARRPSAACAYRAAKRDNRSGDVKRNHRGDCSVERPRLARLRAVRQRGAMIQESSSP